MKRTVTVTLLSMLLLSCGKKTEVANDNSIYRVVFAQAPSYVPVNPAEAFSIDSSLSIKYHGVKNVPRIGHFQSTVSKELWNEINSRFSILLNTPSDSCWSTSDLQILELIVYTKNGVRHYRGERNCLPDSVMHLCTWIQSVAENTLMAESDEFEIETRTEDPLPLPDMDTAWQVPPWPETE